MEPLTLRGAFDLPAARALQADGYHVLVIGRRGHVEVAGIIEDLDHYDVIESADEVVSYPYGRLGIVCQTTASERRVETIKTVAITATIKQRLIMR